MFDSYIEQMGQFFPCLMGGWDLWAKFGSHMNHPHHVLGVLGVSNHPQYQHQHDHFWLILNCLTLKSYRWVNFFPCLIRRNFRQNFVPT